MGFSAGARPPHLPMDEGEASGHDVVLTSGDRTRFPGYLALAHAPTGAGVVILPDVFGLRPFYQELALHTTPCF
jgi:carboxymethylenebutenolidase